jgi:glycosyltransferase involved in cell wall biosynthesis
MIRSNNIKVCHVITSLGVGGAEYMLKRLLNQQAVDKSLITVISLMELGKIGQQLREMGYSVHTLEMKSAFGFFRVLFTLMNLLRQVKPDVLQTWMYHADLLGGIAGYLAGYRRIIWSIHCTRVPAGRPMTAVVMKICAWLSAVLPSKILCVAEAARKNHIRYGYNASRMVVVPNGFDVPEQFKSGNSPKQILTGVQFDGKYIVGCVGRFHIDKGQDLLLQAAAEVITQRPDIVFVLAGNQVDAGNTALTQLIARFGLQNHVFMLGERDDVPSLLPEFDIYCMPSRTEAFPVALGEAMLAGLPCVATRVGDCEVLGGDLVHFVDAGDVSALAKALLEMAGIPDAQRLQLGHAGRERVRQLFSIASISEKYLALYAEVLQSNRQSNAP